MDSVRIDKWLWAARMYKHRSVATRACSGGHVKVNGETAKASKHVRIGDEVEARAGARQRVLVIVALADRRGPASVAEGLYEDHSPPPPPRDPWDLPVRPRGSGRPTKRDRRRMERSRWDG